MKFKRFFVFALLNLCMMTLPMAALAIYTYPVGPVSEENGYATCGIGDAISAASCYGDYCDNTELFCADTNVQVSYQAWSYPFSEEGNNGWYCGSNQIMTGIACSGAYCDNVRIQCSTINATSYNCEWIGPYSEEQGYVYFGGRYANGMACFGSNCDNHQYYVCNY